MIIAANTFEVTATETHSFGIVERGTVEVMIGRETRRVRASKTTPTYEGGKPTLTAFEMTGRYQTGAKAWPASVTQTTWADGKVTESADFGRDDRSGRFNKLNCIFFA
jgi:hypothetical protein